MQSIVINAQYGGFGLSPWAVKRMAEIRGVPCYFFVRRGDLIRGRLEQVEPEEAEKSFMWTAYTVPNPEEVTISQKNWCDMTMEERKKSNASWERISIETRDIKRDDPVLIQVVRELGKKANGAHATLKIVEIPDGVEWEISEYDGFERVEEAHESWS